MERLLLGPELKDCLPVGGLTLDDKKSAFYDVQQAAVLYCWVVVGGFEKNRRIFLRRQQRWAHQRTDGQRPLRIREGTVRWCKETGHIRGIAAWASVRTARTEDRGRTLSEV